MDLLSKVCLFAKRLFFQEKDYDLCDDFNSLFRESSKKFTILRKNQYKNDENSWILNTIHETKGYVLREQGIDRRHFLYSRTGHKMIKIKSLAKYKLSPEERQKF